MPNGKLLISLCAHHHAQVWLRLSFCNKNRAGPNCKRLFHAVQLKLVE